MMKRTCLRKNTNTNANSKHGVPCPTGQGGIRQLKNKLFTDEIETTKKIKENISVVFI
jgi:hypothetical protein